jgi:hypothetical protein
VLGSALTTAIRDLGVQASPCQLTPDLTEAHLFVWVQGTSPPILPQREEPTLLTAPGLEPPRPGQQSQDGRGGGSSIIPPATGNAGTVDASRPARDLTAFALLFLAGGVVAASRVLTGRRSP